MTDESFHGLVIAEFADVDLLICAATGKRVVGLPIDIESWRVME